MKKRTGLIIGSIGGGLYLIEGIILLYVGTYIYTITPNLIAGAIALIGTVIATKLMKIGGIIVLTTIPVIIITGIIMAPTYAYYYHYVFPVVGYPIPFAPPILVIIAGIVFLKNSRT